MGETEVRSRLMAEIDRLITNAVRSGSIVRTGYHAGMLASAYESAGYTVGDIVDAIARAASKRGVPVEISHPGMDPKILRPVGVKRRSDRLGEADDALP